MYDNQADLIAITDTGFVSSQAPARGSSGTAFQPLRYVRRYPIPASIAAFILLLVGGFYLKRYLRPSYSAQSIVYIAPNFPAGLTETHDHDRVYEDFINQQISSVTRRDNLQNAVRKFRGYWANSNEDEDSAVARLASSLKVQQMNRGYQMSITIQSANPSQLADLVNQVTSGYLEEAHKDEFFGRQEIISSLTAKRAELSSQLDSTIHEQDQVLRDLGMAQYDGKSSNPYDTQLQKLRDELADAHAKRAAADAEAGAVLSKRSGESTSAVDDLAASQIFNDPGVSAMVTQLNTRRANVSTQMNGLTPQNPLYAQARAELASIDEQLDALRGKAVKATVGQLTHKLSSDRQSASTLEDTLGADLKRTQGLAEQARTKLLRAQVLSNDIDRIELNYAQIDQRINSLLLDASSPGSEHIVSWAVQPSSPIAKHTVVYLFGLLLFSLSGAFVVAYIMDLLDPQIHTGADIQRLVGFPPIGLLLDAGDFSATMRREYLIRIAGGIDQAHRRTGARSFLFSSAGQGDTRSLVNELGTQLAANGLRTLVVLPSAPTADNDPARIPTDALQSKSLVAPRSHALDELAVPFNEAEQDKEMLRVVSESRQRLAELVRKASPLYDLVLIGGEPLLSSAYTEHLARMADGTVLVAESGKLTKKQLGRAARLLERLKIPGVAVVLSEVTRDRADPEVLENATEYARDSSTTVQQASS